MSVSSAHENGLDREPRADGDVAIVDPWFNFRATKYLVANGFYKFWDWFDDRTETIRREK